MHWMHLLVKQLPSLFLVIYDALHVQLLHNHPSDQHRLVKSLLKITDTITVPEIRLSISPTPIGRKPGFLSNVIRREANKASSDVDRFGSVHIFLITAANILQINLLIAKLAAYGFDKPQTYAQLSFQQNAEDKNRLLFQRMA